MVNNSIKPFRPFALLVSRDLILSELYLKLHRVIPRIRGMEGMEALNTVLCGSSSNGA